MYVVSLVAILFSIFFDVKLPDFCFIIFGLFALISIFVEGKVSVVTNFSYVNYLKLAETYEREAIKTVIHIRTISVLIAIFALIVYGITYIDCLEYDCVSIGFFVLNVCSYVKYLNAEYFLRHDYVR